MATVTGNEHGQVGILLHHLHWNGCKRNKIISYCFVLQKIPILRVSILVRSYLILQYDVFSPGAHILLTVKWGEHIISSVQTQHWHLHRFELVDRTGIQVVVIIGGITKHNGGEPFVELSDGSCLCEPINMMASSCKWIYVAFTIISESIVTKNSPYLHDMIDVITLFKNWSMSRGEIKIKPTVVR